VSLQRQIAENWQLVPENNPDRLKAMRAAYLFVLDPASIDPTDYQLLDPVLKGDKSYPIEQGWIHVGGRWDVPKKACHVAHCGHVYVWVMPKHAADFSRFVLLILHIETVTPAHQNFPAAAFAPSTQPPSSPFAPRLFDVPTGVNSGLFFVPRPR
jgi:hypothetical protein